MIYPQHALAHSAYLVHNRAARRCSAPIAQLGSDGEDGGGADEEPGANAGVTGDSGAVEQSKGEFDVELVCVDGEESGDRAMKGAEKCRGESGN